MSEAKNEIAIYQPNETMRLDAWLETETVEPNRHQMAQLFGRDVKTIGKHISNALKEELFDLAMRNFLLAGFRWRLSQNLRQLPLMARHTKPNNTLKKHIPIPSLA